MLFARAELDVWKLPGSLSSLKLDMGAAQHAIDKRLVSNYPEDGVTPLCKVCASKYFHQIKNCYSSQ